MNFSTAKSWQRQMQTIYQGLSFATAEEDCSTAHYLELPREFGNEKSTNWGRTRKKWKVGKPAFRQQIIWWAEMQGKLRLLGALRMGQRWMKSSAERRCCTGTGWCLRPSVLRKHTPGTQHSWRKYMGNVYRAGETRTEGTHHILLALFSWQLPKRVTFYSGYKLIPDINMQHHYGLMP